LCPTEGDFILSAPPDLPPLRGSVRREVKPTVPEQTGSPQSPGEAAAAPRLVALSGPLTGRSFPLGPAGAPALTLGRHSDNAVQIADLAVSRHHCVLEPRDDGVHLRDLDSRHGTFVNGQAVRERRLGPGDLVTAGRSLFVFLAGETAPGEPGPLLAAGALPAESTIHLALAEARYLQEAAAAAEPRATRALRALVQAGTTLPGLTDPAALAERLLQLALELAPAERAALLLLDAGGEPGATFARDRRGPAAPFPLRRALTAPAAGGTAVLAEDAGEALLCAPLAGPDRPLGLLYLDARGGAVRFDEEQLQLVTALAGIGAAALAALHRRIWLEEENRRLAGAPAGGLVGESPRMKELGRLLARLAPTDSTVLLRGESGTGKEVAARILHRGSRRAPRPFVAINCATLSETLLESELFGHERGAFTGAVARQTGKLEAADGGTLFLDEVGELPPTLQAKLLRVLQERAFERLGSHRPIRVDVRVIAATNRHLEQAIRDGTFRQDLYYRLNVIAVELPPLRERPGDVALLASHFAARFGRQLGRPLAGFTPQARACLERYPWPGNVRELANAIERAVVLGDDELIRPEDLPDSVLERAPALAGGAAVLRFHDSINAHKAQLVRDALAQAGGNVTRAAALLGLHPNYLHRLITNFGLRELPPPAGG
jgi:transcriptional regulator with GAF, ATPase, and Fis domain